MKVPKVQKYYQKNKESVKKITRFDIFNLQYILPRWMLQIPYDILNRLNRKKLKSDNEEVVGAEETTFLVGLGEQGETHSEIGDWYNYVDHISKLEIQE